MTITIPAHVVKQAVLAYTMPYGGKWVEWQVEVIVGSEMQYIEVRLEIQPEAALCAKAETARKVHAQIDAIEREAFALREMVIRGEVEPESDTPQEQE